ncbi:hypothetical protein MBLNU459_g6925t1 [Dothideomycetes sp. NU459]
MSAQTSLPTPSLEDIQEVPSDFQTLARYRGQPLSQISVPSFSAFKDRASSIPVASPVRRKPLPASASPLLSQSHLASPSAYDAKVHNRAFSIEMRTAKGQPLDNHSTSSTVFQGKKPFVRSLTFDDILTIRVSIDSRLAGTGVAIQRRSVSAGTRPSSIPVPLRYDKNNRPCHVANSSVSSNGNTSNPTTSPSQRRSRSSIMSDHSPAATPVMTVQLDGLPRSFTDHSIDSSVSTSPAKRRSKSPSTKFTSFFGWKSSPQFANSNSPDTAFSDRSLSPAHSPSLAKTDHFNGNGFNMGLTPPTLDIHRANASQAQYFDVPGTPFLSHSSAVNAHVEELERELQQVSSELAGSIRREMELEDEVDRFRAEMPAANHDPTRRTSDYFSDSGTSSLRFPVGDSDAKIDELEKIRRKVEQEKAQMQVDYAQRLAEELRQRKSLEEQIHNLEEQLHSRRETIDDDDNDEPGKDDRVRELELFLDEARRRLSQEREAKDNFEDLFAALRDESEKYRNERDNLRDEIVPQLKARVEGLEAEASEMQSLRYEHTKLQQELQTLKFEHQSLLDLHNNPHSQINSIAEDETVQSKAWPRAGLSRSNSLARSSSVSNLRRGSSLTRSGSVKERKEDSRSRSDSVSGDRMKDIEDQRDALHKTLKNLLRRHETEKREHAKAMRRLIADRDRVKSFESGRSGFSREVSHLREEIGLLRRRADDALEQKWQYENNIGGVKMALDRAQQETMSLREYLSGRLIRSPPRRSTSTLGGLGISLSDDDVEIGDKERQAMIKVLRHSITIAETERDAALREAKAYRQRARDLQESEDEHLDKEQELANELLAAADRMEQLAAQVSQHLQSNMKLRERLTEAVSKGERQQSESTARITEMQSRLKKIEDGVVEAQQHSESTLGGHEEEAKKIDQANSPQLSRLQGSFAGPSKQSPSLPVFVSKSPKIGHPSTAGETLFEHSKTAVLERRVKELEAALSEADSEMKDVVERINVSQYEIAALQGERDEAQMRMRRLQAQISDERTKGQALMG